MSLPLLLEAEQLHHALQQTAHTPTDMLIVDLCSEAAYHQGHIPGAVHVNTAELIQGDKPAPGLLPSTDKLNALFSRLGLAPDTHVVCYDDEGGAWSGRFLWTLEVIGHPHYSYLNGGIRRWRAKGFAEEKTPRQRQPAVVRVSLHPEPIATTEELLRELRDNPQLLVWDARSAEEYRGEKVLSQRGGHIPGAIHGEWTSLLDPNDHLRIRQDAKHYLLSLGITPDKHIVTHCQTHRRSGLTWLVMKILAYPHIRAYPGSWSEWGNRTDTPVELSP